MADGTAITPWPGPGWVFDPPPGWPVGRDFDPSRGKGVSGEWPDAPDGWKFWAPAALAAAHPLDAQGAPLRAPARGSSGGTAAARWAIRILVVVLVLGGGSWLWNHVGPGEVVKQSGIGSCWAAVPGSSSSYKVVSCTKGDAQYTITSDAADDAGCPLDTDSYMEKDGGGVWCLKPIP